RVELQDHRQAAERDLRGRPDEHDERGALDPPRQAVRPPRREPRDQRERDRDRPDHAVAELDEGVAAALGERRRAAARPVVAAEAGAGQAHDRSGCDDEVDPQERGDGEAAELAEGQLRAPEATLGRRMDGRRHGTKGCRSAGYPSAPGYGVGGEPRKSGRSAAFSSTGIRSGPRRWPRIPSAHASSPNSRTRSARTPGPATTSGTGSPEWMTSGEAGVAWSPVMQTIARSVGRS